MPAEPTLDERPEMTICSATPRDELEQPEAQSGLSSDSSCAPEVVRRKTIKILQDRIRLLGIAKSGAYDHYNRQLADGFPIPAGELVVLDLVRRRLPDLQSYHEIGSGLGTLPLMLAHDGFASVGIERDEARHLTATAILRELSNDLPHIASNCRLIGAAFPGAVADLDVSNSLAILTDFVSTQAPEDHVRLRGRLAQYRYVLLDLQRFCDKRDTKDEQEGLVEELVSCGLSPCDVDIDLDSAGRYRLFEGKPSKARREPVEVGKVLPADSVATPGSKSAEAVPAQSVQLPAPVAGRDLQAQQSTELTIRESNGQLAALSGAVLPPMPQLARRKRFGGLVGLSALLMIGIPSLLAIVYYGFLASSQYVASFQFAVRGPSQAAAGRAGGAAMMGASAMSPDSFVVTDYINSPQAIADVEREVDLRAMFSKPTIDFWSRLPSTPTTEEMNAYWTRMVAAHFDLISGNISVSVRTFTPQDSLKLAQALVAASDEMFRKLNAKAQQDFVRAADENVDRAQQQLAKARQALFVFQEEGGQVDPGKTALAGASIVDDLRKQLAALQTQYGSIRAAAPKSPVLATLSSQIAALEDQIRREDGSGSSKVKSVSAETLAEYQSLDLERQYADKQYTEALALRNQAYLTAQNQLSYLALFAAPTLAQASLYPNRPRSIAAVVLAAAAAWFVGMLVFYALRDHLT